LWLLSCRQYSFIDIKTNFGRGGDNLARSHYQFKKRQKELEKKKKKELKRQRKLDQKKEGSEENSEPSDM